MVTRQIYVDKHWPLACSENVCVYATVSDTMYLRGGGRRKNAGNYQGMVCCELICSRLVLSPSSYCQNSDFLWFVDSLTDINPCSLDCTHGIFDQNRQHILLSTQLNRGFGSTGRGFFFIRARHCILERRVADDTPRLDCVCRWSGLAGRLWP